TGPIFEGGLLRGQYHQAKASRDQFALQYQNSVLNALLEVSDALIAREKFAEARVYQAQSGTSYQEAAKVSTRLYTAGKASYFEILEAQQQLFPAQLQLTQIQLNQLLSMVQLYKGLGGGWEMTLENGCVSASVRARAGSR